MQRAARESAYGSFWQRLYGSLSKNGLERKETRRNPDYTIGDKTEPGLIPTILISVTR